MLGLGWDAVSWVKLGGCGAWMQLGRGVVS